MKRVRYNISHTQRNYCTSLTSSCLPAQEKKTDSSDDILLSLSRHVMRISRSIVALSLFSIKGFYSGRVISYLALMFFILDRLFRISYDDSFSFTYRHHSK